MTFLLLFQLIFYQPPSGSKAVMETPPSLASLAPSNAALELDGDNAESLMAIEVEGETLEASRKALVAKIGENIQVHRITTRGNDDGSSTVGNYVCINRIGVLVELEGGDPKNSPPTLP